MGTQALVSEKIVTEVFKTLEAPGGTPAELRRLAHEEPELEKLLRHHVELLSTLVDAWGAPAPTRETFVNACWIHLAGLCAAWRLGQRARWERTEGS